MSKSPAVTLVELSIVLAIMGILVVATIAGNSLMNNAIGMKIVQELENRNFQFSAFRSIYNCIPGDCQASLKIDTIYTDPVNGPADGNGNGIIECNVGIDNTVSPPLDTKSENFFVEEHLKKAGLSKKTIPTTFDTSYASVTDHTMLSKVAPKIYRDIYISTASFHYQFPALYAQGPNAHMVGSVSGDVVIDRLFAGNVVQPEPLQVVDTKIDDGNGTTGKVICGAYGTNYNSIYLVWTVNYTRTCALTVFAPDL